jgi:hypothetical protein
MSKRVKISKYKSRPSSESGQAMIEYTLMLIISVLLVLMVATKIFKPLQGFVKNYMGDYIACILETGELPAMGGDSTFASDEGCNHTFEPGTLAAGRPYKGSGASNTANSANKETSSSGHNSGGGGGGSGGGGSSHMLRDHGTPMADVSAKNSKVTEMSVAGGGGSGFFTASNGSVVARPKKESSVFLTGLTDDEKKKIEKKQNEGSTRVIASEGVGTVSKKSIVKPPEPKTQDMADDQPMTIGNFIRILFIICIVLAIVIFIGGQALQMSKSSD